MHNPFVVISGLPGSGKTTLARQLAPALNLPVIDKDDLLGAILVSFWRLPGMAVDSGTPTDWLAALSNQVVNVHCDCEPEVAASRFLQRKRHPGHLDVETSYEQVLASLRELAGFGSIGIEERLLVDTSVEPSLNAVVRQVRNLLALCGKPA